MVAETLLKDSVCLESPLLLLPDAALSPASHASTEKGFRPSNADQMRQRFNCEGVLGHRGASLDRLVPQV